jgi:hypothetical protein
MVNEYLAAQGPLSDTCGDFWQVSDLFINCMSSNIWSVEINALKISNLTEYCEIIFNHVINIVIIISSQLASQDIDIDSTYSILNSYKVEDAVNVLPCQHVAILRTFGDPFWAEGPWQNAPLRLPPLDSSACNRWSRARYRVKADFQSSHEAPRCECLHLIKINCSALWLDESAHACTRSELRGASCEDWKSAFGMSDYPAVRSDMSRMVVAKGTL